MGDTTTYRSRFSRGLAVVTAALGAVLLMWLAAAVGPAAALAYAPPVALVVLVAWLAFWRPGVEVSDGEVVLRNVWRTVHVPWPALQEVDARLGLRLVTAYGSYQAWAAPAPRRARGGVVAPGEAAVAVQERWTALREAGFLDNPRLERPSARTEVHTGAVAAAAGLLLLTVVSGVVL